METPTRPSRKLQEHGERCAPNSSPLDIHCSRDFVDYTAETFINCGYAGILTPNITVKMSLTRGRPRPHAAILRHPSKTTRQSSIAQLAADFFKPAVSSTIRLTSKQTFHLPIITNSDAVSCWQSRQSRHCHYIAADSHNESSACGQANFPNRHHVTLRGSQQGRVG